MDMNLPNFDGVKTTAVLKQNPKTARIPIVALTVWMSELWREKALMAIYGKRIKNPRVVLIRFVSDR